MTTNRSRAVHVMCAFAVVLLLIGGARAQGPKLTEISGDELKKTYQAGQKYTIRMQYTDPAGDEISKSLPLLTYVLFRSANPRGDPSRVVRVGLLIGILACCALFIYLFLGIYGPLVYAILGVGLFAGLILMLRR